MCIHPCKSLWIKASAKWLNVNPSLCPSIMAGMEALTLSSWYGRLCSFLCLTLFFFSIYLSMWVSASIKKATKLWVKLGLVEGTAVQVRQQHLMHLLVHQVRLLLTWSRWWNCGINVLQQVSLTHVCWHSMWTCVMQITFTHLLCWIWSILSCILFQWVSICSHLYLLFIYTHSFTSTYMDVICRWEC